MSHLRGFERFLYLCADVLQIGEFELELGVPGVRCGGAHYKTFVVALEPPCGVSNVVPQFFVRNLARYSHEGIFGHIYEAFAYERRVDGYFRALFAYGQFGYLHEYFVARFQRGRGYRSALYFVLFVIVFVGKRQKAVSAQSAVYKRRLHSRVDALHYPLIYVAYGAFFSLLFKFEFRYFAVFRNGGEHISAIRVEINRLFTHNLP